MILGIHHEENTSYPSSHTLFLGVNIAFYTNSSVFLAHAFEDKLSKHPPCFAAIWHFRLKALNTDTITSN